MIERSYEWCWAEGQVIYYITKKRKKVGSFMLHKRKDNVSLYSVVIYDKYRGKGYANELMRYVIILSKLMRRTQIWLTVDEDNNIAKNLYKKFGFVQDNSLRQRMMSSGIPMKLELI